MSNIKIGNHNIGKNFKPFIVAEMSGNHNQSLEHALKIVEEASKTGVSALKLQTYTPDTMTIDLDEREFYISDPKNLWSGNSLYDLYKVAHTPWDWHKPIFERCKELGLICFSTPFDDTAVDFLEDLNVPCYKIASFENTDLPLIRRVSSTGKPVIISTGMASVSEIDLSVQTARESGCKDLILLKCTSSYPASPDGTNIVTIPHMRKLFGCEIGLSDHTMGIGVSVASISFGASFIEKHFTINRKDGGVDSSFSMETNEMKTLVIETNRAWESLGKVSYGRTLQEDKSLIFRRSLYIVKDVKKGERLSNKNLKAIRPGLGLPIKYIDAFLGKKVVADFPKGTALSWDIIG